MIKTRNYSVQDTYRTARSSCDNICWHGFNYALGRYWLDFAQMISQSNLYIVQSKKPTKYHKANFIDTGTSSVKRSTDTELITSWWGGIRYSAAEATTSPPESLVFRGAGEKWGNSFVLMIRSFQVIFLYPHLLLIQISIEGIPGFHASLSQWQEKEIVPEALEIMPIVHSQTQCLSVPD